MAQAPKPKPLAPIPMAQVIKPISADPSRPPTEEEKRKRFAELRARMNRSQIEVIPPAGKTGYWARKDDTKEMGRLLWLGFSIVHDDPKKPAWVANGLMDDGTYVTGDTILMEIDSDAYEFIQLSHIETHEAMMQNTKATFMTDAEAQGVPTFEVKK